jgi:hypothetical protein
MRMMRRIAKTVWAVALVVTSMATPGAQTTEPAGGPSEGIKVHGDWTIVIRNPDGREASRHEFRNQYFGASGLLPRVLKHEATVGEWVISMQGGACLNDSGAPANCIIAQSPAGGQGVANVFPNLTLSIPSSGPSAGQFVLTGSAKAARAATLVTVGTFVVECPGTVAATSCTGPHGQTFTQKSISHLAIGVVPNQTIDVTVTLSFS